MLKDHSHKPEVALCNVSIETINVISLMPIEADSNGLIVVKLLMVF